MNTERLVSELLSGELLPAAAAERMAAYYGANLLFISLSNISLIFRKLFEIFRNTIRAARARSSQNLDLQLELLKKFEAQLKKL